MRREKVFGVKSGEGVWLTVTRKGIEVDGAYDSGYVGLEGLSVTWDELLSAKAEVEKGMPPSHYQRPRKKWFRFETNRTYHRLREEARGMNYRPYAYCGFIAEENEVSEWTDEPDPGHQCKNCLRRMLDTVRATS